jgi:hypothetical protein
MTDLTILDHIPDGLLDCRAEELADLLPGPTLIHLPGRETHPLFVSVLLHGNEHTGFDAVQAVLKRHGESNLPRAMSLFIGNIAAAAAGVRCLPEQKDFNRCWPGTMVGSCPERTLLRRVTEEMGPRRPFASIDIHNNSGRNPHYACLNRLDRRFFQLALLFSRTVVYFERPLGVQSAAFAPICPSITIECGKSGESEGIAHAAETIEACLNLSDFPTHPVPHQDIDLMRTFAIVKLPEGTDLSFDGAPVDFRLPETVDRLNFSEVTPGQIFATRAPGTDVRFVVEPAGNVRTAQAELDHCFSYEGDEIHFARPVIPAMLTCDPAAVQIDCLCYLMFRIGMDGAPLDDSLASTV